MHTDDSNLDLIPRPAGQRGPSTLDRLKVTSAVARKPGREKEDRLMVTTLESKRGPNKIQSLDLPRGRVNDSQLPRVSPCLAASTLIIIASLSFSPISRSRFKCLVHSGPYPYNTYFYYQSSHLFFSSTLFIQLLVFDL